MPLLNWKSQSIGVASSPHPVRETQLTLDLPQELIPELATSLLEIYSGESAELRHTLPDGWTLFWKMREGDSRALLAHPEAEEWVGTLALTEPDGAALVASLRDSLAAPGNEFSLDDRIGFSRVSNLSLRFTVR